MHVLSIHYHIHVQKFYLLEFTYWFIYRLVSYKFPGVILNKHCH